MSGEGHQQQSTRGETPPRTTRGETPPTTTRGETPNINAPNFDEPREHDGFRSRRARLGHQTASERLGGSLWEIPPGQAAYPYHYHLMEEEMVVVLSGRPSLRTPVGWRELTDGEVCSFPRGEAGAHQLVNRTEELVRFLSFSTHGDPDIVIYPDSQKLGVGERLPRGGGLRSFFKLADAVDYWEGEQPWEDELPPA